MTPPLRFYPLISGLCHMFRPNICKKLTRKHLEVRVKLSPDCHLLQLGCDVIQAEVRSQGRSPVLPSGSSDGAGR